MLLNHRIKYCQVFGVNRQFRQIQKAKVIRHTKLTMRGSRLGVIELFGWCSSGSGSGGGGGGG